MEYVICTDGGGTKTETIAYNRQGEELFKSLKGYANLTLNQKVAVSNIIESIEECTLNLKEHKLVGIYMGIAGIEVGENRKIVKDAVQKRLNIIPEIYNDAQIALYALLKGEEGILTIAGTGSISIGTYKGLNVISGGWGHLLGDEGSGYYIVIEALKKMIYDYEEGLSNSKLTEAILENLDIESINSIKQFIYSATKNEIAAIAPLISKMAEQGEKNAVEILQNAGVDIAKITERVWTKLGEPHDIKVALKGSIITKVRIVRETFDFYIKNRIKGVTIKYEDVSSAKGGYYLSLKKWGIKNESE
ncbi:BadF/BadG/BcrA/BcrD ATPase family protein [Clostridium sp. MB40-C1]|uniref:BadF/BadG/BcrA/BcrD ATPase family protein n=1 Tax=Clostridium sp. MB40-C1 TaxID=3070996 RepID=UPI0027DF4A7E|nr:BadF/BadG/BcrA/BcrD ATPase family protein [Clostridium sp. MB40-C1]WMJ82184.1 BadF/BadG/BcrA/BcrD ATPase family protein [Clostridium sp. MB40-C1]